MTVASALAADRDNGMVAAATVAVAQLCAEPRGFLAVGSTLAQARSASLGATPQSTPLRMRRTRTRTRVGVIVILFWMGSFAATLSQHISSVSSIDVRGMAGPLAGATTAKVTLPGVEHTSGTRSPSLSWTMIEW